MDSSKESVPSSGTMSTGELDLKAELAKAVPFYAFVSYVSGSLKDSTVFCASADAKRAQAIKIERGLLALEERALFEYKGKNAGVVLGAFCQEVVTGYRMSPGMKETACGVAQHLIDAHDKGTLAREHLPFGIQGVQELDWTKQEAVLKPLRERHQERKETGRLVSARGPRTPFCRDPEEWKDYLPMGNDDEEVVVIEAGMIKTAGIVKFLLHTFEPSQMCRSRCSWAVFVSILHPDFQQGVLRTNPDPIHLLSIIMLVALKVFSEARSFVQDPSPASEVLRLLMITKRKEFDEKSTSLARRIVDDMDALEQSDAKDSAQSGEDTPSGAAADKDNKNKLSPSHAHLRKSSSSSTSSTRSDNLTKPNDPEHPAIEPAKPPKKPNKKKKKKPKKQGNKDETAQEGEVQTPLEEAIHASPAITNTLPISTNPQTPDLPDSRTGATPRPQGNANQTEANSEDQSVDVLEKEMAKLGLPSAPVTTSSSAVSEQPDEQESTTYITASSSGRHNRRNFRPSKKNPNNTETDEQNQNTTSEENPSKPQPTSSPASYGQIGSKAARQQKGKQKGKERMGSIPEEPEETHETHETSISGTKESRHIQRLPQPEQNAISNESTPPQEFKFDSVHPKLRCTKPDCRMMTHCWDPAVVICPACGPKSYVRYCKKQHLYDDIQRHWAVDCGKLSIEGPIDEDTIRPNQTPVRPYLIGRLPNFVERHRQAVYRSMEKGDYFIFADIDEIDPSIAEPTGAQWTAVRGKGKLQLQIIFEGDHGQPTEKEYFNQHIHCILKGGKPAAEQSCIIAVGMIRNALIRSGNWTDESLTWLCMQLPGEWGVFKVPDSFWNVAEVNAVYSQQNRLPLL